MSLEGLQPHPNLKALGLYGYMGENIPSWVSSLTNLVDLWLRDNRRCQHLPLLNQLPFLKTVSLLDMAALEYMEKDTVSNLFGSSSLKATFFPSLYSLELRNCPNMNGWWMKDYDNDSEHMLLPSFPRLLKFGIYQCPNLTSMSKFPFLKEELQLYKASSKVSGNEYGTKTEPINLPLMQLSPLRIRVFVLIGCFRFRIASGGVAAEPRFSPETLYNMV